MFFRIYFVLILLARTLCGEQLIDAKLQKDPELTKEEAFRLLDEYVPLPEWGQEVVEGFENFILPIPGEDLPDYELLEKLQEEERLREAIDAVNERYQKNAPIKIAEYFEKRESLFIRDPEKFLSSVEKQNVQDLLINHAGDSEWNIHLSLFYKGDLRQIVLFTNERHEDVLADDHSGIMVYYFFDDPNRTIVYFSKGAKKEIPPAVRRKISDSALHEATLRESEYLSLYQYLLDFTLQLSSFKEEVRKEEQEKAALKTPVKKDDFFLDKVLEYINIFIEEIGWLMIGAVTSGLFGLLILLKILRERAERKIYKFPINDCTHHLNYPKGGGTSGTLLFKKGALTVEKQERELHG